jgi:iron-sulfur cluster assembly accessory protein
MIPLKKSFDIIKVSSMAIKRLGMVAKEHNTNRILFYVKGGGCNGFNYKLEPMYDEPEKLDEVVKCGEFDIVVCNNSIMHLLGVEIDWKKDIMGETFRFENPNAGAKCGCGTSFSIKK